MPAKSAKQKKLMDAVAHNSAFAKKVGIPQSVGKDFSKASKGKKFRKGGDAMKNCYSTGGMSKKGAGIAKKGFATGGMVSGVGSTSQGRTLSVPVKKSVHGDTVQVRGVGAARSRTAKIY
jgi:hypothetical protein